MLFAVLFYVIVALPKMVTCVCTPRTGPTGYDSGRSDLELVVRACLFETPDGSCPLFAAATNGFGCNNGGVNGQIGDWDVSSVTHMYELFGGQGSFNANIANWNTEKVTNMKYMFQEAVKFNADISKWVVSKVTDMQQMFSAASSFDVDVSSWNVRNVTNMIYMFSSATQFNVELCGSYWVSSTATQVGMFKGAGPNAKISKTPPCVAKDPEYKHKCNALSNNATCSTYNSGFGDYCKWTC